MTILTRHSKNSKWHHSTFPDEVTSVTSAYLVWALTYYCLLLISLENTYESIHTVWLSLSYELPCVYFKIRMLYWPVHNLMLLVKCDQYKCIQPFHVDERYLFIWYEMKGLHCGWHQSSRRYAKCMEITAYTRVSLRGNGGSPLTPSLPRSRGRLAQAKDTGTYPA